MIAAVELSSVSPQAAIPLLPLTAFIWSPGDRFAVMVVEGDGSETRAKMQQVELGDVAGNRVAVLRGLNPGARVITTGASMVAEGELIEVLPTEVP
jgi:multidrug efflux system membrane fusion protein